MSDASNPGISGPPSAEPKEDKPVIESDDNSVLDDEAYVGTAEEYRNAAYPEKYGPRRSDDEDVAEVEAAAKAVEVDRAENGVGFLGFNTDTQHPSKKRS